MSSLAVPIKVLHHSDATPNLQKRFFVATTMLELVDTISGEAGAGQLTRRYPWLTP